MDNQQSNLNQQPQQPPTPQQPPPNKLWPINWRQNIFIKIIGALQFVYLIYAVIFFLLLFNSIQPVFLPHPVQGWGAFIEAILTWLIGTLLLPFGLFQIIFSFLRLKKLDKIDKFFIITSSLSVIGVIILNCTLFKWWFMR